MKLIFLVSRKIWDPTIIFLFLGLTLTIAHANDIEETDGEGISSLDDKKFSNGLASEFTDSDRSSSTIVPISKVSQNSNTTDNSKDVDIPNTLPRSIVENVTRTSVENVDSTTDASDSDSEPKASPKFNFAIIAAIAVLILLTVLCLKCCGWFRAYTRAGDKEDSTQYATIVHTDDEEYGHIDIQSDTASTVYFDTVSSYQSFLKRNGNDSSLTSSRSQRLGFFRQNSGSPRKENGKSGINDFDVKYIEMKQIRPETRAETPDTCSPRSESATSENVRTFSVSSEDTDQSNIVVPLPNNDDINNKKNQRTKVSFTTDNSKGVNRLSLPRGGNRSSFKQNTPVDRHKRTMSCRSTTSRFSDINDTSLRLQPLNNRIDLKKAGTSVDVATQTNRSFTYSRWKTRKRHYSDSGVDETVGPPTIQELSSAYICTDNCGHTCASPKKRTQRTPSPIRENCDINRNKVVINKNNKGGVLKRGKLISESESNDEVFAPDGTPSPGGVKSLNSFIPDEINMCTYNVVNENISPKSINNHNSLQDYVPPSNTNKSTNEVSDCSRLSDLSGTNVTNLPYSDKQNEFNENLREDHCNSCLHRKSQSGKNSKSRSFQNCDGFLTRDSDVIFDHRKDVHENENLVVEVMSPGVKSNVIPIDVYEVKDGISKLKDVNDDNHTLIIERDSTSSMTSLESSGYAEISSDASTS